MYSNLIFRKLFGNVEIIFNFINYFIMFFDVVGYLDIVVVRL